MYKKAIAIFLCIIIISLCNSFSQVTGTINVYAGKGDLLKVVAFSAGDSHTLAIMSDGTLWAWGSNQFGQLGDGTMIDRPKPVQIGKDKDWYKVAAGTNHSLAIKKDGTIWSWGCNVCGQLGDGTTKDRAKPFKINNDRNFTQIAAGSNYSMAIKNTGTLWECGDINEVRLNEKYLSKAKLRRFGSETDWDCISSSSNHVLALKRDGSLWAWGASDYGQLGNGKMNGNILFMLQVGNEKSWKKISAGERYSLAQKKDGSLWRWGYDTSNQDVLEPVQVGSDTDWVSFSAGSFTTAVKSDGSLWSWSQNDGSIMIIDTENMSNVAPAKIGEDDDWSLVESGTSCAVAMKKDGSLWSWGYSRYGELGNGTMIPKLLPTCIDKGKNWVQVSAGFAHTLALKKDGSLWAWGSNYYNECCIFSYDGTIAKPAQVGAGKDWARALSYGYTSLAIKKDGTLWGWGNNDGILGGSSGSSFYTPVKIGNDSDWMDISGSTSIIFGLKKDGTLWMWGSDYSHDLFSGTDGNYWSSKVPVQVGKNKDWMKISAGNTFGNNYIMAIKKDGSLWGWGFDKSEYDKNYPDRDNFSRIVTESGWVDLAAGASYFTAIKKDGSLWCWDVYKHKADPRVFTSPVRIGKEKNWMKVSSLNQHVLCLTKDGKLWAFGSNFSGEIGDGARIDRPSPVMVGKESKWRDISAGVIYSAAINYDGTLWTWGDNSSNQLGVKKPEYQAEPGLILGSHQKIEKSDVPDIKEVIVATAEELVKEISSNKRIILKPGIYDLSAIKQMDSSDHCVQWKKVYDGKELNISNVYNLTIEGSVKGKTEIRVTPRYANIMSFKNASVIMIKNIKAGHTPAEYECDEGVLRFEDCHNIMINNSELYGCGSIGITAINTDYLNCIGTLIDHCSLNALYINNSNFLNFLKCEIIDNKAFMDVININKSIDVRFEQCKIAGNNHFQRSLVETDGNSNVLFSNCKIINNSQGAANSDSSDKSYLFKTIQVNDPAGKITVNDTEITNNICDCLSDSKDAVTFSNCKIENNVFKEEDQKAILGYLPGFGRTSLK